MDQSSDGLRLLAQELRRELKEMLFNELMKRQQSPGRAAETDSTGGLECSLDALGKLLEDNVARLRDDLRLLTHKLNTAEAAMASGSDGGISNSSTASPRVKVSLSLPFLPPPGHRTMPSPLHLGSPGRLPDACVVALPKGISKRHPSLLLPTRDSLGSLESSGEATLKPRARSLMEESGGLTDETMTGDDEEEENDDLPDSMTLSQCSDQERLGHLVDELVTLNVGGRRFQTYRRTLMRVPGSLLGRYVTSEHYAMEKRESTSRSRRKDPFFDRNSTAFEAILDFYRTGVLLKPPELHEEIWKGELGYWDIKENQALELTEAKEEKKQKKFKAIKRTKKKKRASTKDKDTVNPLASPPGGRSWEEADVPTKREKTRQPPATRHTPNTTRHTPPSCVKADVHCRLLATEPDVLGALIARPNRPASLKDVSLKLKDKETTSPVDLPPPSTSSTKKKDKSKHTTSLAAEAGMGDNNSWKKKSRRSGSASDLSLEREKPSKSEKKKEKREHRVERSASNQSLT